jgi:hypothetical protein
MITETKFEFDKLNRVPKKGIQLAILEYKEKYPDKALNRYKICEILSAKLEEKYLIPEGSSEEGQEIEESQVMDTAIESDDDGEEDSSKAKKNYNGQHILKKMKLDTTKRILEKIDFYIYRYY